MSDYFGFLVHQRTSKNALPLFVFAASSKELHTWTQVQRTADQPKAAQRLLSKSHWRSIRNYLEASERNIIPTAITIALDSGKYVLQTQKSTSKMPPRVELATLSIKTPTKKPGVIIDGQHRLEALAQFGSDLPVLVVAILGADNFERALHFVVINNKAKRVPTDVVKGITAELSTSQEAAFRERLARVGVTLGNFPSALYALGEDPDSPFCGLLDWDINRDGTRRVKPAALEAALRSILSLLKSPSELEIGDAVEILCAMWRGARTYVGAKSKAWTKGDSKLIGKAGLPAVTEFLIQRINNKVEDGFDPTDIDEVEIEAAKILAPIPKKLWTMKWAETGLDTTAGRGIIVRALADIRTNVAYGNEPFEKVALVGSSE